MTLTASFIVILCVFATEQ